MKGTNKKEKNNEIFNAITKKEETKEIESLKKESTYFHSIGNKERTNKQRKTERKKKRKRVVLFIFEDRKSNAEFCIWLVYQVNKKNN